MVLDIKEKIEMYKKIYKDELPKVSTDAGILLENSLYLSIFTLFEDFLKTLIENYNENKVAIGIKFCDLSESIAREMFLGNEKKIKHIFDDSNDRVAAFENYFNELKSDIKKEKLDAYIRFEYMHKNKINSYYKDLFCQILGDGDFLKKINLSVEDYDGLLNISGDAYSFLLEYTDKIRNCIAHQNSRFEIGTYKSFDIIADTFIKIINNINSKYEENTGFKLSENNQNILDDFSS